MVHIKKIFKKEEEGETGEDGVESTCGIFGSLKLRDTLVIFYDKKVFFSSMELTLSYIWGSYEGEPPKKKITKFYSQ